MLAGPAFAPFARQLIPESVSREGSEGDEGRGNMNWECLRMVGRGVLTAPGHECYDDAEID